MHVGGHVIHSHLSMEGSWDSTRCASGGPSRAQPRWQRPAHTARGGPGHGAGDRRRLFAGPAGSVAARPSCRRTSGTWARTCWDRTGTRPRRCAGCWRARSGRWAWRCWTSGTWRGSATFTATSCASWAGCIPATPVGQVPGLPRTWRLAKRLLEANKDRPVRSTTGGPARGDAAVWVYGLAGKPCKRCGTLIRHAKMCRSRGAHARPAGYLLVPALPGRWLRLGPRSRGVPTRACERWERPGSEPVDLDKLDHRFRRLSRSAARPPGFPGRT